MDIKAVDVSALLKKAITHRIVTDQSLDLPKVIRTMSHAMALYKARQEAMPMLKALKDQYINIRNTRTDVQEILLEIRLRKENLYQNLLELKDKDIMQ